MADVLKKINVLIVDDSPLMRAWLKMILTVDPEIGEVVTARNPYEAETCLRTKRPDVVTLDVEMPGMSGLSFLKQIMSTDPLPVIMVSAYTQENCQTTIHALSLGAVDFIPKPGPGAEEKEAFSASILTKVKEAAHARTTVPLAVPDLMRPYQKAKDADAQISPAIQEDVVIGIGASTGGTQALSFLFAQLPEDMPPIIIVQHMPAQFTGAFADHLDGVSRLTVKEATPGSRLTRGLALVVPGDKHGRIKKDRRGLLLTLNENPPVNHHRPSVDVLFYSLAESVKEKGIGILLTGMGEDGARGLLAMRKEGAMTLAQDESTSTIFGMPQAAIKIEAVRKVISLEELPAWLIKRTRA